MGGKIVLASALALAVSTAGMTSSAVRCQVTLGDSACIELRPPLQVSMGANVSPRKLPANEYAPVTWSVFGKFARSSNTHLPALREMELDIDKDVKLSAKGFPVCKRDQLDTRDPTAAIRACRAAILGLGEAHVEIAFPEREPVLIKGPLTVLNGGEKGDKVKLLLIIVINVPVPAAVVTEVTIIRKGTGIHSVAKIPVVAGGSGSLVDFKFKLGKTYSYKDREVGYFEAKCPDGVFKANVKKVLFKNEAQTPGEGASTQLKGSLAVPCTTIG